MQGKPPLLRPPLLRPNHSLTLLPCLELKVTEVSHVWAYMRSCPEAVLFPSMLTLATVMFIIPVQTADVERGFSVHRILKNRLTNRMKVLTLDSLLRIKLLTAGQSVGQFDRIGAAKIHSYVPMRQQDNLLINKLFKKVHDVELGLLDDGIEEGSEPDMDVNDEDETSDVESEEHWLSSSDDEERAVDEEMLDGVDCFGEVLDIKGGGLHYDNEEAVGSEHERAVREFEDI